MSTSSLQPQPQRILITGATGALGSAVLKRFLDNPAVARIYATSPSPGLPTTDSRVSWLQLDLTRSDDVQARLGDLEIDAAIHCAGGFRYVHVDQLTDTDLDFLLGVNLRSSFYLARALIPGMKKRGFGRLLFVSARATEKAGAGMGAYVASKAGVNALVQALADEVRDLNINVNAVLPTILDTPVNRADMPQADFSKWVKPEELAEIFHSLVLPWGNPLNGALIPVSGRL